MSSKLARNLRSTVEKSDVSLRRSYVDRIDMIGTISPFYSEDSPMSLINLYRNTLSALEKDHTNDHVDHATYVYQKTRIESEIAKLYREL
jgi:hypothetical protein